MWVQLLFFNLFYNLLLLKDEQEPETQYCALKSLWSVESKQILQIAHGLSTEPAFSHQFMSCNKFWFLFHWGCSQNWQSEEGIASAMVLSNLPNRLFLDPVMWCHKSRLLKYISSSEPSFVASLSIFQMLGHAKKSASCVWRGYGINHGLKCVWVIVSSSVNASKSGLKHLKKVIDLKTIMHDLKYNCFPMMGMCTRLVPVLLVGETERPNSNKGMSIISPWSISCTFALQISHTSFKSSPSKLQFATLWHRGDYCYTIAKGIRIEGHQCIG